MGFITVIEKRVMMKFIRISLVFLFCLLWLLPARAQVTVGQVTWRVELKKISKDTFDLIYHADIKPGWYLYSSQLDPYLGPIPTSFGYITSINIPATFVLVNDVAETGLETHDDFDEIWETQIKKLAKSATFTQRIVALDKKAVAKGSIEWMVCNDESCLPPDLVYFNFDLAKGNASLSNTPTP